MRDAVAPKQQQSNSSRDFGTNALAAVSGQALHRARITGSLFVPPTPAAGGAAATLATHPMDVAKTLMQTSVQVMRQWLCHMRRVCLTCYAQRPLGLRATLSGVVAQKVYAPFTRINTIVACHIFAGLLCSLGGIVSSPVTLTPTFPPFSCFLP